MPMCKTPKNELPENVIKGPWKAKSKKDVVLPEHDVIEMQENLMFCDNLIAAVMVQLIHSIGENGFDVHEDAFLKDMGFIIEAVRSTLYRDIGYNHPMGKVMAAFTKSNIDPKGEVGDGFELPGLDDAKIRKLIEDLDEEEEDPDTSA